MKTAAYWEEKVRETHAKCKEVSDRLKYLEIRYLPRAKTREQKVVLLTKLAKMRQQLHQHSEKLKYFKERIEACRNRTRFDRTLKSPPL